MWRREFYQFPVRDVFPSWIIFTLSGPRQELRTTFSHKRTTSIKITQTRITFCKFYNNSKLQHHPKLQTIETRKVLEQNKSCFFNYYFSFFEGKCLISSVFLHRHKLEPHLNHINRLNLVKTWFSKNTFFILFFTGRPFIMVNYIIKLVLEFQFAMQNPRKQTKMLIFQRNRNQCF